MKDNVIIMNLHFGKEGQYVQVSSYCVLYLGGNQKTLRTIPQGKVKVVGCISYNGYIVVYIIQGIKYE